MGLRRLGHTSVTPPTAAAVLTSSANSIGFLRLTFAAVVILHHSFTLRYGWEADPLWRLTHQIDLGSLAVASFLVLSGYLVSASLEKTGGIGRFYWHRFLRIYPGFWTCLLVSVCLIGPVAYSIEHGRLVEYLTRHPTPAQYLRFNCSIFIRQPELAGLFNSHHSHKFNGSLWTLSLEASCYLLLPLLALLSGFQRRRWITLLLWICGLAWYAHDAGLLPLGTIHVRMFSMLRVAMFFASGVVFYAFRGLVPLNDRIVLGSLAFGVLVSAFVPAAGLLTFILLPIVILWLAVRLPFRNWERTMDLSYGTYVYAYPLQQLVLTKWPAIHWSSLFLVSLCAALALAFASWTLVEKPALRLKDRRLIRSTSRKPAHAAIEAITPRA